MHKQKQGIYETSQLWKSPVKENFYSTNNVNIINLHYKYYNANVVFLMTSQEG